MSLLSIVQKPALPRMARPIVIIGAGGIVRDAHLPAYSKAGFEVAGIFDIILSRAESLSKNFDVGQVFPSLETAIGNAPESAVFDLALPASEILEVLPQLPDGRGVLIQKPMGQTLTEAKRIRDLCHQKQLTAAVNFQLRFAPFVLAARSLIAEGTIGAIHDLEFRVTVYTPWHLWTFLENIPRVEILYHSIHYLDLIRSFLGNPSGVYAKTVKHPRMPKLASTRSSIVLDYGEATHVHVTTNHGHEFGQRHQESYVKWEGTLGAIWAQMGVLMNYPHGEPDQFEYCVLEPDRKPVWESIRLEGTWFPDAFIGTMASLMCYLENSSANLPTSVDDAYNTMALVEACYESSARDGTRVQFG